MLCSSPKSRQCALTLMSMLAGIVGSFAFTSLTTSVIHAEDLLPRRVSFGTQLKPVSDETKEKIGLKNKKGAEVVSVLPNSNAETLGVQNGDVILSVSGKEIPNVQFFVETLGATRANDKFELVLNRNGESKSIQGMLAPLAMESSTEFDTEYGSVETSAGRLRTVTTIPKGKKVHRGILLLSGLGIGFVEHPQFDPTGMKALAYGLTKKGFAVMRVDKPGCGDSQGGPAKDADFHSIVDGYVAALKAIKKHPKVEPNSVTLFGASMGGVQAPLVAEKEPVAAIGIFGAMSPSWIDFITSTAARQMKLSGVGDDQLQQEVDRIARGWKLLIEDGITPDEIAIKDDTLTEWVDSTFAEGTYFSGIHYRFFQQAGKSPVKEAWAAHKGRVLSLWGAQDVVTSKADHELIAEVANKRTAGSGVFLELPEIDHNMRKSKAGQPPSSEVDPSIVDAIAQWLEKQG